MHGRVGHRAGVITGKAAAALVLFILAAGVGVGLWMRIYAVRSPGYRAEATPPVDVSKIDDVLNTAAGYQRSGEPAKAEVILRQAIELAPQDQTLRVALGEALTQQRKLTEAYDEYVAALSIGPRTALVEFTAGTLASMLERPDRAEEHYAAAQAADPTDWRAPLFLAQVQIKQSKLEEAQANLIRSATLKEDNAVTWGTLAELSLRQNQLGLALQHIRRARALEPRVVVWRVIEARGLKRQGDAAAALDLLVGLEPVERQEPGVLALMAECYGMLSRPGDAAALYAEASRARPDDGRLALETALWFERAGKPSEGLPFAERAAMLATDGAAAVAERLRR
jgi:Tfp pilus assembly protein PilF